MLVLDNQQTQELSKSFRTGWEKYISEHTVAKPQET